MLLGVQNTDVVREVYYLKSSITDIFTAFVFMTDF